MLKIHKHTFNPFMENTFVLSDETNECAIIDPGCHNELERNELLQTIKSNGLKPVLLLNTHCHIDHFPGNKFVSDTFGLTPQFHRIELEVMLKALDYQTFFGMECEASPEPKVYLNGGDVVKFGNTILSVLFTPGHSPGSLSFYSSSNKKIISGDVLFREGVGRYDIPGADGITLFHSIETQLMTLPDDVVVYCGHGPETTIGYERKNNPFLVRESRF